MSEQRRSPIDRAQGRLLRVLPLLEAPLTTAIDLEPGGRLVESALAYLVASEGDPEGLAMAREAALEASRLLDDGDDEQDALEAIRRLLGEAAAALEEADRSAEEGRAREAAPLRASEGLPGLHRLGHEPVTPRLRLPPGSTTVEPATFAPLPAPTTHEELESHADRQRAHIRAHLDRVLSDEGDGGGDDAPSGEKEPARSVGRFVERWARECLEEAAMLGSQRRPLPGDDWRTSREFEDRLVWNVDAFAALAAGPSGGRALDLVETWVLDAPAPDPWRLFSAGMILGCFAGRDSLAMVDRLARALAREPEAIAALAGAWRVCPHPGLTGLLRDWLEDSDPAFRAVAAEVLVARSERATGAPGEGVDGASAVALTEEGLVALSEDRREIAAEALMPLALRGALPPDRARALLETPQRDEAIAALAVASRSEAVATLRQKLDDDPDWAAPWLASLGGREEGARVVELALGDPTPPRLLACGIAGLPVVDDLLPLLSHDDVGVALATAQAIDRITGAGLRAVVEVPAEQLLVPDLPEPPTGGFFAMGGASMGGGSTEAGGGPPGGGSTAKGEAGDAPPEGAMDRVELPPADAGLWGAWWRDHRDRFERGKRHRRGEVLSPRAVLREIEGPWLDVEARRRAGAELLVMVGRGAGWDARDFVCRQEVALARWASLLG